MTLRVKAGVVLDGVQPIMFLAAAVYDIIRTLKGWGDGTITSGTDGGDSVGAPRHAVDPHDYGLALDLRTNDLIVSDKTELARLLRLALGALLPGVFTVVEEVDHVHVQLTGWRGVAGV